MKNSLSLILADNLIRIAIYLSLVLLIVESLMVLFFFSNLPPLIPLLNSRPWGQSRLEPASSILLIPLVLIIVFLLNNFLSAVFYRKNSLIARILAFNALLFIGLGLLAIGQISLLVF